jgi:hypothetical protein
MNEEIKPFDRETRIMLLSALKRGYFTNSELDLLSQKTGLKRIEVEVIDRREQVRQSDYNRSWE